MLQILKYKSYSEFGIYHMIAASQADLRAYFNLSHYSGPGIFCFELTVILSWVTQARVRGSP